jgi:hypothetical protein
MARKVALATISILLLSFSGVLFSASLSIGKALETVGGPNHHAALLRANDRYWQLFPLQLIAVGVVASFIVNAWFMPSCDASAGVHHWFKIVFRFAAVLLVLLVADYMVGQILFDWPGFRVMQYLMRP